MTLEKLLEKVRSKASQKDIGNYPGFLAIQVNLTGDNGGVFYVEIKDSKLSIEPYEYNDRNALLTISAENFEKLLDKKLDPVLAYTMGKLKVEGDVGKVLELTKLL